MPEKLWPMNWWSSSIKAWIASVIWNSPPLPGFNDFNLEKIVLGNMYLPITALLEGEVFIEGFSTTLFIIKLFLSIFFLIL